MFGISEFTVRWTGLFALAIAVIPVGVDAQRTQRTRAEAGDAEAQFTTSGLGTTWAGGRCAGLYVVQSLGSPRK